MTDADDLALALRLADAADARTLAGWRHPATVAAAKADGSPVTAVDVDVERALRGMLAAERPDDAFLGEEEGGDGGHARVWVVDPLDHTAAFARGLETFATLIALVADGVTRVGVVSAPALGRRWWAVRGGGAYGVERGSGPRRLHVSSVARLADAYLSFAALPQWDRHGRRAGLHELAAGCRFTHGSGGFLAHMLVAEGRLDVALDPWGKRWDLAAVRLVVEEAGGRHTDVDGRAWDEGGTAVGTNGRLHDAVLRVLSGGREDDE